MSGETAIPNPDAQVTATDDSGRTLSGVGVSVERLEQTIESREKTPPEKSAAALGTGTPTPDAGAGQTPAAPQTRGRARFADLTRERDEAKAAEKAAREELSARLRELEETHARASQPSSHQAPQAPQQPQQPPPPQYTRPEPSVDEIGVKYETYEQFIRDLQRWEIEQYHVQTQQAVQQQVWGAISAREQERQFVTAVSQTHERGAKAYPDFQNMLKTGPGSQIPLGRSVNESLERAQFVIAHPQSEHVQYAILKDAALAQRLQQSDPYTFGQIIAGLVPPAPPSRPAWTPPPAPYEAVGSASATAQTSSSEIAQKGGGFDAYRAKRAAERGVKARY